MSHWRCACYRCHFRYRHLFYSLLLSRLDREQARGSHALYSIHVKLWLIGSCFACVLLSAWDAVAFSSEEVPRTDSPPAAQHSTALLRACSFLSVGVCTPQSRPLWHLTQGSLCLEPAWSFLSYLALVEVSSFAGTNPLLACCVAGWQRTTRSSEPREVIVIPMQVALRKIAWMRLARGWQQRMERTRPHRSWPAIFFSSCHCLSCPGAITGRCAELLIPQLLRRSLLPWG